MSTSSGESMIITAVGEQYSTIATVLGRTALPVFGGSREEKFLLDVQLENNTESISLLERPLHSGMIATWLAFREAGLPVAPELFTGPKNTVFVTDVKADGSEVYGKYLRSTLQDDMPRERPRPKVDELFVELLNPRKVTVDNKISEYVAKADDASITLPWDDPFELIIRPDGEWDLITLDLAHAKIARDDGLIELASDNSSNVLSFSSGLSRIYEHLIRQGVASRKPAKAKWYSKFPSKS